MKISDDESKDLKTVEGKFSDEIYMNREDLVDFIRNLADEVENKDELELETDEWVLPFKFSEDVKVEIERDYDELEIEIEFNEKKTSKEINVR